jgi:Domain of unknown function (DUF4349)
VRQPDHLAELREHRPVAPAEVRELVRLVAAQAAPPPRRITWKRAFVVAVPVAAAIAAAAVLLPGGNEPPGGTVTEGALAPRATPRTAIESAPPVQSKASPPLASAGTATSTPSFAQTGTVPAPSVNRTQRYSASLELRVAGAEAVSDDTKQAVEIARALGGFASSVDVEAAGRSGSASLVLRVPKQHVQQAVARLSALGTIVGENVSITDLQAQVDTAARKIAGLKQKLATWQAMPQTLETEKHVAALTTQIARLQHNRSATIRTASLATVRLDLTTAAAPAQVHRGHGPLHGLGVAFRWVGIGAVYTLAFGAPIAMIVLGAWLATRTIRRRRDDELLSRS